VNRHRPALAPDTNRSIFQVSCVDGEMIAFASLDIDRRFKHSGMRWTGYRPPSSGSGRRMRLIRLLWIRSGGVLP
jgi:hypothetical protein